jgi:hypothetical protein
VLDDDKSIDPPLGRLALVALCVVGLGAASPIMFRDNFNRSDSAGNWETVSGTWTVQNGKLTGRPGEAGKAGSGCS